jgi:hypothetical protein
MYQIQKYGKAFAGGELMPSCSTLALSTEATSSQLPLLRWILQESSGIQLQVPRQGNLPHWFVEFLDSGSRD